MSAFAYRVTKVIDAPRDAVWSTWTEVDGFEKLFHAKPGTGSLDVRPGGAWQVTMVTPDGSESPMAGTYGDVEPGRRLVTKVDVPGQDEPSAMELELVDAGDGRTEVVLSQVCRSQEEHDFSKQGSEILLEWCAEAVSSGSSASNQDRP